MRLVVRLALALAAVRGLLRRRPPREDDVEAAVDPRRRELPRDPAAELAVAILLVLGGLLAAAFAVLVAAHPQTQLLGATLAGALACVGAAMALASKRVVVQEVAVEERHPPPPEDDAGLVGDLRSATEGITRRRALAAAAGVACCGLAGAALLPVTGLGPGLGDAPNRTPWRRGRRLVDPLTGAPVRADDLEVGAFQSAMPEGASPEDLGAPVMVVRVEPSALRLPRERRTWAPEGLLAFSQICTHAACAVTLFRYPVDPQTSKGPALVCPCHYSTFDVTRAAEPVFGPAARALPQLPLAIAADRTLVAAGPLSGSVGPSYWGVRPS
ncbi:MAG: ubiquinol-cytochrome c reductase iron-sulfur subunit [Solirubrobacteraceae bacterium]|jgi:ubiquinol-cytochrome c reductase iron-sulfur subunit|nr:ubiquinol-cytochrome c reductase iron-sulfur subunit [Solirubrobacteraceae bacterium]